VCSLSWRDCHTPQYVAAEQAMLRTFGRIMPVRMPLSGVLAIALVGVSQGERSLVLWLRVAAAFCLAVTVVTTLTVNVPINARTASWKVSNDPSEWQDMRKRWHAFHGGLFGAAFALLTIALIAGAR
jgi:hypothetical protein